MQGWYLQSLIMGSIARWQGMHSVQVQFPCSPLCARLLLSAEEGDCISCFKWHGGEKIWLGVFLSVTCKLPNMGCLSVLVLQFTILGILVSFGCEYIYKTRFDVY